MSSLPVLNLPFEYQATMSRKEVSDAAVCLRRTSARPIYGTVL